jgi:type IV pilus assembly protein PilB
LVLSTLHTNSACGAIPRLLDMKAEPFLIASTLNVVIGQRLVRQICPDSSIKYHLNVKEIAVLAKEIDLEKILVVLKKEKIIANNAIWETIDFYRPQESEICPGGYKGRVGIREVLEVSAKIKELIIASASSDEIQKIAEEEGMITMLEDGFIKAAQGLTSIEEVLRVSRE